MREELIKDLQSATVIGPEDDGIGRVVSRLLSPEERDLVVTDLLDGLSRSNNSFLWCCHVRGPDDVYAAPDYITALAWSDALNEVNWKANSDLNIENPKSFQDCLIKAVPAPWPHSAESHAEDLPKSIAGFSSQVSPANKTGDPA